MINRKVKLAVTYFDWELLEDNTSCSCLEMFASTSKLFERIMSDDSLDFIVLIILPFNESLKWNKSFFLTFICRILPAWNGVSQPIYPVVWLIFCRGLPLAGSDSLKLASRKSILFYVLSAWFVFYQRFIFDQYSLLWNENQPLPWFF